MLNLVSSLSYTSQFCSIVESNLLEMVIVPMISSVLFLLNSSIEEE